MSTNPLTTGQKVTEALAQVVGLPLTAFRRAADMRTIQFGQLRTVERGSVGDFALHIQCPWRIEGPQGIITGRADLWHPAEEHAPFDDAWDYEKSPNLQDARMEAWLAQVGPTLVVAAVDADEYGGATIALSGEYLLRLFPAGTRGEDWRLFRPGTSHPHFVVSGGVVEPDDETT